MDGKDNANSVVKSIGPNVAIMAELLAIIVGDTEDSLRRSNVVVLVVMECVGVCSVVSLFMLEEEEEEEEGEMDDIHNGIDDDTRGSRRQCG